MSFKTKKLKMDHEPVRVMAEPPPKIYHEVHQKAATQRCARNDPSKKSEPGERNPGLPIVNGTIVPELVSPPPPPPTTPMKKEELLAAENLERFLASMMDQVEWLSPPPKAVTNPNVPPSLIARKEICPFHPERWTVGPPRNYATKTKTCPQRWRRRRECLHGSPGVRVPGRCGAVRPRSGPHTERSL